MKTSALITTGILAISLVPVARADDACQYMKSRSGLSGYETGGPYKLEHFRQTKGRTDLREFLWNHWHGHTKGVAEAKVGTVDAGTVTELFVVQPNAQGQWGIDVELDRPVHPPCVTFHVDSLARIPIRKPDEDYPSQRLNLYLPDRRVPETRLADSEVKDAKYYRVVLVANEKVTGDTI